MRPMTHDTSPARTLFPPIEPYCNGMLVADELHTLYWEECGNPHGVPVIFLHGGPGAGCSPMHRRFFDPAHFRIVLLDQRGAGRSTPLGEVRNNTTPQLVQDLEQLREHLGIAQWLVFGGSWGSTLALAYGQTHPQRCLGFVLRGIFLCTAPEIDWFMHGIRWFFPEAHAQFRAAIGDVPDDALLSAYGQRIFGADEAAGRDAARTWSRYESSAVHLLPTEDPPQSPELWAHELSVGRLEAHYFLNRGFMEDDQLILNMDRIRHLPAVIVQGRYDVICPPRSAWRLAQAWPRAQLQIIPDAGHSALEPGITAALVAATERFRQIGSL